jgi:hypothetical protein
MARINAWFAIVAIRAISTAQTNAMELKRVTAEAWQAYVGGVDARMQARLEGNKPFLWMDESADRARTVKRGEIVVAPLAGHGTQSVPDGLIHDWIGAVFVPNATIDSLLHVVHDYGRYKDMYKPVVKDSRLLQAGAAEEEFSMVWQRHVLFVTAAIRGLYRARDVSIDSRRGYSLVEATNLQQIEDYGRPGEHLLPPDTGFGFIWRVYSVARYEQRDQGVYLEIEAIALSRDIPSSMRWLVTPVVNHLSVNSLTATLGQTRDAVDKREVTQERLATKEHIGVN